MEQGDFMTLEKKAQSNSDIRKLYGAPFIYLWGEFLISPDDIDWKAFRQAADSPPAARKTVQNLQQRWKK